MSVTQKDSRTFAQSPLTPRNGTLNSTFTKPPPQQITEIPAVFQKKSRKDTKLVTSGVRPMGSSGTENRHDKVKGDKKLPSYLSLTKSATFKRVQHNGTSTGARYERD